MIDLQKIVAASQIAGFRNYTKLDEQILIPATSLTAGSQTTLTYTYSLDNSNAVSRIRVNYAQFNSVYYQLEGPFSTYTNGISTSANYDLYTFVSYTPGNILTVQIVAINLSFPAVTVNIPEQTVNLTARLFKTPFA